MGHEAAVMRIRRTTIHWAVLLLASIGSAGFARSTGSGPIVIVAEGDSLTYGQDTASSRVLPPINGAGASRSATPYPETLERLLGRGYTVLNHGFPGDRTTEGLARWPATPQAKVVVLMYGTNDCMNYGGYSSALSVVDYSTNLQTLVQRRRANKARIIIVAPPPLADPAADRKCQPYRSAAAQIARRSGAIFYAVPRTPNMWSDGVHLSADAYARLARGVLPLVRRVAPRG